MSEEKEESIYNCPVCRLNFGPQKLQNLRDVIENLKAQVELLKSTGSDKSEQLLVIRKEADHLICAAFYGEETDFRKIAARLYLLTYPEK